MRKLFFVLTAVVLLTAASKVMTVRADDSMNATNDTMSNETMTGDMNSMSNETNTTNGEGDTTSTGGTNTY